MCFGGDASDSSDARCLFVGAAISACEKVPAYLLIYIYSVLVIRASMAAGLECFGGDVADCGLPEYLRQCRHQCQ